jgi:hypothetical protein
MIASLSCGIVFPLSFHIFNVYSRHQGFAILKGPASVERTQRKNTGTVNLNFSKTIKNNVKPIAIRKVYSLMCNKNSNKGNAANASIK